MECGIGSFVFFKTVRAVLFELFDCFLELACHCLSSWSHALSSVIRPCGDVAESSEEKCVSSCGGVCLVIVCSVRA